MLPLPFPLWVNYALLILVLLSTDIFSYSLGRVVYRIIFSVMATLRPLRFMNVILQAKR